MRTNQTVDIIYADSFRWSGQRWIDRYKRWWMRQEQIQLNLMAHDVQLPQQEDTVECGVFVTCYHQVVFDLSQEEQWRDLNRDTSLQQLKAALEMVTPMVAAQKRRHTRETLHKSGQRLAVWMDAQLDALFVDLTKVKEETTSLQQTLRRKRKRVERVALTTSSDTLDPQL
jgi:hypothetical protein